MCVVEGEKCKGRLEPVLIFDTVLWNDIFVFYPRGFFCGAG